jgi:hypothetical protein
MGNEVSSDSAKSSYDPAKNDKPKTKSQVSRNIFFPFDTLTEKPFEDNEINQLCNAVKSGKLQLSPYSKDICSSEIDSLKKCLADSESSTKPVNSDYLESPGASVSIFESPKTKGQKGQLELTQQLNARQNESQATSELMKSSSMPSAIKIEGQVSDKKTIQRYPIFTVTNAPIQTKITPSVRSLNQSTRNKSQITGGANNLGLDSNELDSIIHGSGSTNDDDDNDNDNDSSTSESSESSESSKSSGSSGENNDDGDDDSDENNNGKSKKKKSNDRGETSEEGFSSFTDINTSDLYNNEFSSISSGTLGTPQSNGYDTDEILEVLENRDTTGGTSESDIINLTSDTSNYTRRKIRKNKKYQIGG